MRGDEILAQRLCDRELREIALACVHELRARAEGQMTSPFDYALSITLDRLLQIEQLLEYADAHAR